MVLQSQVAPRLEIIKDASKILAESKIRILNPFSDEYDAVSISCSIVLTIQFELLNEITLAGKIIDMEITVKELQVYFVTDLITQTMNSQVKALADPLKILINTQLV